MVVTWQRRRRLWVVSGVILAMALAAGTGTPARAAGEPQPPTRAERTGNDLLHIGVALLRLQRHLVSRTAQPLQWSAIQVLFGVGQTHLGKAEQDPARLAEAAEAIRSAIEVRSKDRYPQLWAQAQAQLAEAERARGLILGDGALLNAAATAFRAALSVHRRATEPFAWATLQNELGMTLWAAADLDGDAAGYDDAAIAFRMALGEFDTRRTPGEWLLVQSRLALVLEYGDRAAEDSAKLALSARSRRMILDRYDRRRAPDAWATAQTDLARVLVRLGERERGTASFRAAEDAYRAALDALPVGEEAWEDAVFALGYVLDVLGERESNGDDLAESLEIYTTLLAREDRTADPMSWAMIQNNICVIQRALGQLDRDPARLRDAVDRCRQALDAIAADEAERRAMVQDSLGEALTALGAQEQDSAPLAAAIAVFGQALGTAERQNDPRDTAGSRGRQAVAMMHLAALTDDPVLAARAADQLEAAGTALRQLSRPALAADFARQADQARAIHDHLAGR